jgi:hypothetical protein
VLGFRMELGWDVESYGLEAVYVYVRRSW